VGCSTDKRTLSLILSVHGLWAYVDFFCCFDLCFISLFLGSPARNREFDLMILMGPFQLEILYDTNGFSFWRQTKWSETDFAFFLSKNILKDTNPDQLTCGNAKRSWNSYAETFLKDYFSCLVSREWRCIREHIFPFYSRWSHVFF